MPGLPPVRQKDGCGENRMGKYTQMHSREKRPRALWQIPVIIVAALSAGGCSTSSTSNTASGLSLVG